MPPGMFMDESEVQSSRALEAHSSNIAKQRETAHHIRKAKRGSSGVAQSTGEDSASGPAAFVPTAPRGLKVNDAANYDSDENSKPQGQPLSDVERRLQERGLSSVFDPVVKTFASSSFSHAASGGGQVSISRLVAMPEVGVGRNKLAFVMRVPDPSVTIKCKIKRTKVGMFTLGKNKKPEYARFTHY